VKAEYMTHMLSFQDALMQHLVACHCGSLSRFSSLSRSCLSLASHPRERTDILLDVTLPHTHETLREGCVSIPTDYLCLSLSLHTDVVCVCVCV
jgi:hypothetical protein